MKIYTGNFGNDRLVENVNRRSMGIMVSSSPTWMPKKCFKDASCALDNGAYQCWRKGYPFISDVFMKTLLKCYALSIELDFIVCPDIVAGGVASLDLSVKWATNELVGAPRLALVVQDGITIKDINHCQHVHRFTHIFVGGTVDWKWRTAKGWVEWAHSNKKLCHIGRCGQIEKIRYAKEIGADSIDSTTIARDNSWHIVEDFVTKTPEQQSMRYEDAPRRGEEGDE